MMRSLILLAVFAPAFLATAPSMITQADGGGSSSIQSTPLVQPFSKKALQLQQNCVQIYLDDFNEAFRDQSKMALPNCYTDPQDSDAIRRLAQIVKNNPKEARNIAKIVKSWSDNRAQCIIKQTAYSEAVRDAEAYLEQRLTLKEAARSGYEGLCAAPNPYTTSCQTIGSSTVCNSGGGGLPASRMVCHSGLNSSSCTFTSN